MIKSNEPRISIAANISYNLHSLAKENNIGWTEALEFGVKIMLADKNLMDYPECNLKHKITSLVNKLTETSSKLIELEDDDQTQEIDPKLILPEISDEEALNELDNLKGENK